MKKALLISDLTHIAGCLGKSGREKSRPQLLRLQEFLGSTDDLFIDGRRKMWGPGGSARVRTLARQSSEIPKPEQKTHRVSWRNGGTVECTMSEAVEISGQKSPRTLATAISKRGGKFSFIDADGDDVTITRV